MRHGQTEVRALAMVRVRRGIGLEVRPEAEQVDGREFYFLRGWELPADHSRYPGETAWMPLDDEWPRSAPAWIASGDLVFVKYRNKAPPR